MPWPIATLRLDAWGEAELRLDAWREAELRFHGLALGSSERQEAQEDARSAANAFHAAVAQLAAHSAEEEFQDRNRGVATTANVSVGPQPL